MKWKTAISVHRNGALYVRGVRLTELLGKMSFSEAIFFLLQGKRPTRQEIKMLDALLVAMIEHGVEVPSAFVSRSVASTGNSTHTALAAGILAMGEFHGGAIEEAARNLQSRETPRMIVARSAKNHTRVAGYGHKIYKSKDPRVEALLVKLCSLKLPRQYVNRALAIEKELQRVNGKVVPLNIDGAAAAMLLDLGFNWELGKSFFVLGRLPGLIAHAEEERKNEKPYRRFAEEDVEYVGVLPKK